MNYDNKHWRHEAINYLKARYAEQCDLFPTLRNDVSEARYLAANLPFAIRNLRRIEAERLAGEGVR
jgi:hypothetical protein